MNKKGISFPKQNLKDLFALLQKDNEEIIAPAKKEDDQFLRMLPVGSVDEICFEGISWFTSKKYVFPETQELFSFQGEKLKVTKEKPKKRVLFGLRLCDLNAFAVNDHLFLHQEPVMNFYKTFRENLTLVGFWCDKQQDEYCFCDSMNLTHRYDLMIFDRGANWHVKSGSTKGEKLIKSFVSAQKSLPSSPRLRRAGSPDKVGTAPFNKGSVKEEEYETDLADCERKLKTHEIEKLWEKNDMWQKGADDCLSCADCTTLCPTCLCFDIEDETDLSGKCGTRCAKWDSCMYKDFTLVAGGHVFRNTLVNRFKHRIFHKLEYFREQFNELMCTGCGRCIRGCPTKIDWIELVNKGES